MYHKRTMENRIEQEIRGMDRVARLAACRYVNERFESYDTMLQFRKGSPIYGINKRREMYCYMHYYRLDAMYGPKERRSSSLQRWNEARSDLGLPTYNLTELKEVFYG